MLICVCEEVLAFLAQIDASLDSDNDAASQTDRDSNTALLPGDADCLHIDELGVHEKGGIGLLDDHIGAVRQPDRPPTTGAAQASNSSRVSAEQSAMSSEAVHPWTAAPTLLGCQLQTMTFVLILHLALLATTSIPALETLRN